MTCYVITGPTACGKSDLAMDVVRRLKKQLNRIWDCGLNPSLEKEHSYDSLLNLKVFFKISVVSVCSLVKVAL